MIQLGDKVKCKITGMTGTALARCEYLNGCVQFEVQPKKLKDGEPVKSRWIDEQYLVIAVVPNIKKKIKPAGGGFRNHPGQ